MPTADEMMSGTITGGEDVDLIYCIYSVCTLHQGCICGKEGYGQRERERKNGVNVPPLFPIPPPRTHVGAARAIHK